MDMPPEKFRFGFEDSEEDKNSSKTKSKKAKNIGAFASSTVGKTELPAKDSAPAEKDSSAKQLVRSEVDKAEAEPERIEERKHQVIEQETAAEIAALEHAIEDSKPGSAEHTEAIALKAFTERLNEKSKDPSVEIDDEIDQEFERRMAEIDIDDITELLELEPTEATSKDNTLDADTEEVPQKLPIATTTSTSPSAPVVATNSSSPPPISPTPPTAPPAFSSGGATRSPAPVSPSITSSPNSLNQKQPETTATRRNNGEFLIGGVLGYMVGRRGGRKRTERRLQPEINKLNTEVQATKRHLSEREAELRKVANERVHEQQTARREAATSSNKRTPVNEILRQTISAPEAIVQSAKHEHKPQQPVSTPESVIKKAEQLSTPELLQVAETLFVGGVSVRKLYESNRIDRVGLVRVVQEGMRGRSVSDEYEKVELGRERQRERAREFRHDDPGFTPISDVTPLQMPTPVQQIQPLTVPNNPDPTTLTPIAKQAPDTTNANDTKPAVTLGTEPETNVSYVGPIVIFVIGIALIVVWLMFNI